MSDFEAVDRLVSCAKHEYFMKYCWQRKEEFLVGYHTAAICDRIDKAIIDYRSGKSTFLMIKVPFRHGKSDMMSRYLPPHFLGEFPDTEVIVAGYSSSLTADFSKFSRKLVQDDKFKLLYPKIRLSKDEQSVDVWGIDKHLGKVHWVGLGGSITGKGGNLILIDDFFKGREEAESELMRDKVWSSFSDDIMTRRAPVCIVIVLATPWHTDDLFGRINNMMEEDPMFPRFDEMKFPARGEQYKKINGTEWLFPQRFDNEWYLSQYSTLSQYASSGLLDCDPVIKHGNLFNIEGIKTYTEAPEGIMWTRGWDLASSEKQKIKDDPDFTASIKLGVMWQANPSGEPMPVIYIDDSTKDRMEALKRNDKIVRISKSDLASVQIGIESYGPYKDAFKTLETILWGIRSVIKVQRPGDKVTRAEVLEPIFRAGNVYMRLAPWNTTLIKDLGEFPGGAHDDSVDALVTAFALHKPFVKHIFPYMAQLSCIPFNINWGKKDESNSLHYGAIVFKKDLTMWAVAALWDDVAGQLFVYDCEHFEEPDVRRAALWMIVHMRLKQYNVDNIICNDRMCAAANETEKNMQWLFKEEFKKANVQARLHESIKYDQWGSIGILNTISKNKMIFFDDKAEPALIQCQMWSIEKNKPSQEDSGYCECLTYIVSELKRKKVFEGKIEKRDYMSEKKYLQRKSEIIKSEGGV